MRQLILLYLALLLVGCNSNKPTLAQLCAEAFPVQDSIVVDTLMRSDTIILADDFIEYIDTTICPPGGDTSLVIRTVTKRIPGRTIIKERIVYDSTIIRADSAYLAFVIETLEFTEKKLQETTSELEKERKKPPFKIPWWATIIGAAIVFGVTFTARKKDED